jgi:hypothetical protein
VDNPRFRGDQIVTALLPVFSEDDRKGKSSNAQISREKADFPCALKNNALHFLLKKLKKSLSTVSTSIKPRAHYRNRKCRKVLTPFWRFSYKQRSTSKSIHINNHS